MNRTVAILAMVLVSAIAPVSAFAGTADQQAYAGSHVAFDAQSNALVDYRVDGEQTVDSVRVQSQSDAESNVGLGGSVDLEAVADMTGAALSLETTTDASASLRTDSGAAIEAHDNGHGSLVVTAADESQFVALNVSGDADVERVSDERVVFTTGGGTTATAMIAGEGSVTATGDGNLTASLEEGSRLAVRAYTEGRADAAQERLIVDGTAAASVYVMERGGQTVTDTVAYSNDTTVEVSERAESGVDLTVSRAAHEGRVVIAHVTNETFESAGDVQVSVDGEAAARASSYAELREAASGGENSEFLVQGSNSASAQAETDVVVGINHFSTREVAMTDAAGDDSDQSDGSDGNASDGDATDGDATDDDSSDDDSSDGDSSDGDSADDDSADDDSADGAPSGGDSSSGDSADDDTSDGDSSDGDSNDAHSGDESDDASSGDGPGFGVMAGLVALAAATALVEKRRN